MPLPVFAALQMLGHELLERFTLFRLKHLLDTGFGRFENAIDPLPYLLMCAFQLGSSRHQNRAHILLLRFRQIEFSRQVVQNSAHRRPMAAPNKAIAVQGHAVEHDATADTEEKNAKKDHQGFPFHYWDTPTH